MYKMGKKMENFIRVIKTWKKKQVEIVERTSTITGMINSLKGLNGWLDTRKKISKPRDDNKTIQNKAKSEKKISNKKQTLSMSSMA